MIAIRTERELDLIRESCRIVGYAHRAISRTLCPGLRTRDLDEVAEQAIHDNGGTPAFKGYHGYPATTCISINEEVIHGIPGDREICAGDLVSVDIGAKYRGYFGDQAITYAVGEVTPEAAQLMSVTRESLLKGIQAARAGGRLGDISGAIQQWVESHGFSVVRQFVGHGIGRKLHEDPAVPNYVPVDRNPRLRRGITLAVEPMVNMGGPAVTVADDGWTASTNDGTPSAHFEHVIAIDGDTAKLLTMTEEEIFGNE
jgi:methionyl aminopeptidase